MDSWRFLYKLISIRKQKYEFAFRFMWLTNLTRRLTLPLIMKKSWLFLELQQRWTRLTLSKEFTLVDSSFSNGKGKQVDFMSASWKSSLTLLRLCIVFLIKRLSKFISCWTVYCHISLLLISSYYSRSEADHKMSYICTLFKS